MLTLKNRTMVISGGAGNNGLAIVSSVIKQGMNVAFFSSSTEKGKGAVLALAPEQREHAIGLSALDDGYESAFNAVMERFGSVDVIVNGAGGHRRTSIEDTDKREFEMSLHMLDAAFFTTKAALPYLKKSSAPRVINLSTCEGLDGGFCPCAVQAAARGGLVSMTYALAKELGQYGITVNCVNIAPIEGDVPRFDSMSDAEKSHLLERTPLKRLGEVRDVPAAVEFLASEEASFVTGAVINVTGGLVIG